MKTWYLKIKSAVSVTTLAGALFAAPLALDTAFSDLGIQADLGSSAVAQAKEKETRRLPGIGEKVFKGLGKVSALTNPDLEKNPSAQPDFPKAYQELKKLEKQCSDCNNYEKAQIYLMFAYVSYTLENYSEAIDHYKNVIKQSPQIPIGVELQAYSYVSKLAFQLERYDEAIKYFDLQVKLSQESGIELTAKDWQFKAVICYTSNKKDCAFESITKAIDMVEASGKIAEESWYNIKRALYMDKDQFKQATAILEKLIRHYPKKSYWDQLGSMYGLLERPKDQLHAMDTTYLMGGLTNEKSIVNLAYLYMAEEVPYRAAKILETALKDKSIERSEKNLETLALAWQRAREREKAIPVLEELGKMSDSGNAYSELVGVYLDLNNPRKAVEFGKKSLNKGNFKRGADGQLLVNLGIAYFELRQYSNAIEMFERAAKIKKTAKFARGWLRYSETEKKRYEGLRKSLAAVGLDIEEVIR